MDTGGTFTDFVLYDGNSVRIHKVLSTPADPAQAILQGIDDLGVARDAANLYVFHGSTVATNAVLEAKGVRTLYVANRGFRDVLTLGRQARRQLYNLEPLPVAPPVPREYCFEVGARCDVTGTEIAPLTAADIAGLRQAVADLQPEAVAINLLFSFVDDRHEHALAQALGDTVFVSCSSQVLPEYREYERGIATWLNAWVGPLMDRYLERLQTALAGGRLSVMQSSGGTMHARQAGRQAVRLLLSGPAGGLEGARYMAGLSGHQRVMSFDMGGTSTDVALIDRELQLTSEGRIGPYPVAVPMVDMHTIGAGGGSIATVDAGGLLQVGPESAGAAPGPACYGQGGERATVTDANLVLGRLLPDRFLGGRMSLDVVRAQQAVAEIARQLAMPLPQAALGIIQLANEHMARALRVISVQRGEDPRTMALVCFGGAGGLHVCALADALQMQTAIVPMYSGVLSALGMLVAPPSRELSRSQAGLLAQITVQQIEQVLDQLTQQARSELIAEGVAAADLQAAASIDLRYQGQSYYLNVPWQDLASSASLFHQMHRKRYGHALDLPVELVNVRVKLSGRRPVLTFGDRMPDAIEPVTYTRIHGCDQAVPVYHRHALPATAIAGPLLITETVSTTFVDAGWKVCRDAGGNLVLQRDAVLPAGVASDPGVSI